MKNVQRKIITVSCLLLFDPQGTKWIRSITLPAHRSKIWPYFVVRWRASVWNLRTSLEYHHLTFFNSLKTACGPLYLLPDIRYISRDVVLCTRIEVIFSSWNRWFDTLVLHPQFPPFLVILRVFDLSTKNLPSPLVDKKTER